MLIGILSDTHDRVERTRAAVKLLGEQGAEVLIHCGDLTGPKVVSACSLLPCYYVFGNNDFDQEVLERSMRLSGGICLGQGGLVDLGGRRIAVTHGDVGKQVARLQEEAPDYLLLGHTHEPRDERVGATRVLNPGALHRATRRTVALLDLAADKVRWLEVG